MPIGYSILENDMVAWYTEAAMKQDAPAPESLEGKSRDEIADSKIEPFESEANGSAQDFADLWSNGYQQATMMGMANVAGPGTNPITAALNASGINSALKAAMDSLYSGEVEASIGIFAPVGAATIAYWAPAMPPGGIAPVPPPPPGVIPSPGPIIIDPGFAFVNKIAQAWVDHWTLNDKSAEDKVAALIAVHKEHTDSIKGLWTGLIPGAPPVPHVANWTGFLAS